MSNLQIGIIILLSLFIYGLLVYSTEFSLCFSGNTTSSSYEFNKVNETESATNIEQFINIFIPLKCDIVPTWVKLFFDLLFVLALWYFISPTILGTKIGRE